jgi:hypothetical protein
VSVNSSPAEYITDVWQLGEPHAFQDFSFRRGSYATATHYWALYRGDERINGGLATSEHDGRFRAQQAIHFDRSHRLSEGVARTRN